MLKTYPNLKLIFTGSNKGNKEYILNLIDEYLLNNSIIDLGFVPKEELKWLHLNSQGLVMPTFLGSTNMPILEASDLGCNVVCSNLEGQKEQLGDYGYYFDPNSYLDIANKIEIMLCDNNNNIKKVYISKFNIDAALKAIEESFEKIKSIRFCWGSIDEIF